VCEVYTGIQHTVATVHQTGSLCNHSVNKTIQFWF